MTQEIYRGKHSVQYSQVALFDAEDVDSYPQFETGEEQAIFGKKGVVVSTANDKEVDITVCEEKSELELFHVLSGEILVGSQGLIVGNETTADTAQVPYTPGKVAVAVYVNAQEKSEVTSVVFVLSSLV
jgi:hypothetical protein